MNCGWLQGSQTVCRRTEVLFGLADGSEEEEEVVVVVTTATALVVVAAAVATD